MPYKDLSPEEERIIVHRGTETPFSGEYDNLFQAGTYACRRCGALLYRSNDKFDAHCGWPSFDREIHGQVLRRLEDDGLRTEIVCANCGAHLGHVFLGEKMTPLDTRHCVNSLSLKFIPASEMKKEFDAPSASENITETAIFGGGCFWCSEATFQRLRGVSLVMPGYAGGHKVNPSYEEVSSGETGQAEVISVEFDPALISYEMLLEIFFSLHDPTSVGRQGNDIGEQYRSIILTNSKEQAQIARRIIKRFENDKAYPRPIVTEVKELEKFYPAEAYHLDYFARNGQLPYCQLVIAPKLRLLLEKFPQLLKK